MNKEQEERILSIFELVMGSKIRELDHMPGDYTIGFTDGIKAAIKIQQEFDDPDEDLLDLFLDYCIKKITKRVFGGAE